MKLDKQRLTSDMHSKPLVLNPMSEGTNLSKVSGAGLLSNILNPNKVTSVQTIQRGRNVSNIYVNTCEQNMGTNQKPPPRKKITIITKKKRPDGSYDTSRQEIYKDYGDNYAHRESKRLNSAFDYYRGSAQQLPLQKNEVK